MPSTTKLYVGNLPDNCKDDTIRDLFAPYGEIAELAVIKNFAFVHFKDEEIAKNAVRDLNRAKLLGNEISVEISKSRGDKDNRGNRDRRDGPRRDGPRRDMPPRDRVPGGNYNMRNDDFAANLSNLSGLLGIGGGGIGGIGGGGHIPPNPMASAPGLGIGILSAVNTLAAVAEKQKEIAAQNSMGAPPPINRNPLPPPPRQNERAPEPNFSRRGEQTSSEAAKVAPNNSSGYVIYERFYVDPTHALLKGLPLPELPRAKDSFVGYPPENTRALAPREDPPYSSAASRDASRSDLYAAPPRESVDNYRARSPLGARREFDSDRWNPAAY